MPGSTRTARCQARGGGGLGGAGRCGGPEVQSDGERRGRQAKRLERTRYNAQMPSIEPRTAKPVLSVVWIQIAGAHRRRVVHRAVAMIAVVHAGAFERGAWEPAMKNAGTRTSVAVWTTSQTAATGPAMRRTRAIGSVYMNRCAVRGAAARDSAGTGETRRVSRTVPSGSRERDSPSRRRLRRIRPARVRSTSRT